MYLKYSGYPDYKLSLPIDWGVDPFNDLNWQYNLCSLGWIEELPLADSLEVVKDFYNYHIAEAIYNPILSEKKGNHIVPIRFKVIFDLYQKHVLNGDLTAVDCCLSLLKSDLKKMLNESNYIHDCNHGIMVDLALLYCTKDDSLASLIDINEVMNRAEQKLYEMFSLRGFTKENSILYQVLNSALANEFFYYAKKYKNKKLMEFIKKINESTYNLLQSSIKKDGSFFSVGSSSRGINKELIRRALVNLEYGIADSEGISYPTTDHDAYLSTDVGLFFYSYISSDIAFHMAFSSGGYSDKHKQNDDLAFCFDVDGISILDDVGYVESVEKETKEWFYSEKVHSNFSIWGEDWLRSEKSNEKSKILDFNNFPSRLYVKAKHERFSDETSTRELFFDKKNKILWVSDFHLRKDIKSSGVVETRFVLNPQLKIIYKKNNVILIDSTHSILIHLQVNASEAVWSDEIVNYIDINGDQTSTKILKCKSPLVSGFLHSISYSFKIYTKKYDSKLSIGENIIENNIWHTPKFGNVFFGDLYREPWDIDPFKNRSWVWLYQQLSFVKDLLAYDRKHNSRKGLNLSLDIIKDWGNYHVKIDFTDRAVWHDHGSAIRLRRLLDVKDVLTKRKIWSKNRYGWLDDLIKKHIFFLRDDKFYSRGNNHGLDQSTTLFLALMHYQSEPWFSEFLSECNARLEFEIQRMFDSEGGHFENSPAYQALGISQLIVVNNLLKRFEKFSISIDSKALIEKATLILAYMITPQGVYAPIGDTESISPDNVFPNHSLPESYKHYLFAINKGKKGLAPISNSLILPNSGWAFYRSEWKNENDFYLLAKSGFKSTYHRQDDDTSFILCYKNETWLTDGGLYNYHENDSDRIFIRSHLAHNLTSPMGVKALRNLNAISDKTSLSNKSNGSSAFNILMKTGMFEGYSSKREIRVEYNNNFLILDEITSKSKIISNKKVMTRFVIPNNKKVEIGDSYIEIFGKDEQLKIELISDLDCEIKIQNIFVSEKFNALVKVFAVDFIFEGYSPLKIDYYCSWGK